MTFVSGPGGEVGGESLAKVLVFVDDQGVIFNQSGPFESRTVLGPDGRVTELQVFEGTTPVLSAVRAD